MKKLLYIDIFDLITDKMEETVRNFELKMKTKSEKLNYIKQFDILNAASR